MPNRLMTRLAMMTAVMVGVIAGFIATSTTTVSAATFTYDEHAIARVDTRAVDRIEARPTQLSGSRDETASPYVEARGTPTTPSVVVDATEAVPGIKTPYGVAEQGADAGSIALRGQVESGGTVYRQRVTGTQQTAEGQFWAGQNPASTPGYANSYGTPGTQVAQGEYPWIMGGTVEPGTPFVTRGAPGIGMKLGGAPEVVVNPGGVRNLWFHMPD